MDFNSPKGLIITTNFLNRKGLNPVAKGEDANIFKKQFKRDLSNYLDKQYSRSNHIRESVGSYITNYIPEDMWCEYDSEEGYERILKMTLEKRSLFG
jgi:hypothetical protein